MVSNNLWEYSTAFHKQLNAISIHQNVACIKLFVSQNKIMVIDYESGF